MVSSNSILWSISSRLDNCTLDMKNLIIAYGDKNVTLNLGEEHITLTKDQLAFIIESAIKHSEVNIKVSSN